MFSVSSDAKIAWEYSRFLKHSYVDLWIIHIELRGGHKSIQAKAKEERRAQDTLLWINSVPGVSIVKKLYVVLKYTMKRCTNLAINNIVKLNTAAFWWVLFPYLK